MVNQWVIALKKLDSRWIREKDSEFPKLILNLKRNREADSKFAKNRETDSVFIVKWWIYSEFI